MISWILYTLAVGGLVAVAARGAEEVGRVLGRPIRWIWAGALLLTLVLAGTAERRAPAPVEVVEGAPSDFAAIAVQPSLAERLVGGVRAAFAAVTAVPLGRASAAARALSGRAWDRALLGAWVALSTFALLAFSWTSFRVRAIRRRSALARLHGTEVRVSDAVGPVAVGLLRHEIVVPRWVLGLPVEQQRWILAHEEEHCRARDPLLLAAGWIAVALVPWHPAIWWMVSRLRLAAELDCDARVLRRGVEPLEYGRLLIAVAGRRAGARAGAAALLGFPSHLERRLRAMMPGSRRFSLVRACGPGVLAAVTLLAACEASIPTAAEIESADIAALERPAPRLLLPVLRSAEDSVEYIVDGVVVGAEEARAIPAERIASIKVEHRPGTESIGRIRIETTAAPNGGEAGPAAGPDGRASPLPREAREEWGVGARGEGTGYGTPVYIIRARRLSIDGAEIANGDQKWKAVVRTREATRPAPLLFVDGSRADAAALENVDPSEIRSIEVVKGPVAVERYGEEAAGGVLRITTK